MASTVAPGCPVHSDFDPLSPRYLEDPFAVLQELPAAENVSWSRKIASTSAWRVTT